MILAKIGEIFYYTEATLKDGTPIYLQDIINFEGFGECPVDIIYSRDNINFFVFGLSGGVGGDGCDVCITDEDENGNLVLSNRETFPIIYTIEDLLLTPYVFINGRKICYGNRVTIDSDSDVDTDGVVEALVFDDNEGIVVHVKDESTNIIIKVSTTKLRI